VRRLLGSRRFWACDSLQELIALSGEITLRIARLKVHVCPDVITVVAAEVMRACGAGVQEQLALHSAPRTDADGVGHSRRICGSSRMGNQAIT
jgi:hypothetical protein